MVCHCSLNFFEKIGCPVACIKSVQHHSCICLTFLWNLQGSFFWPDSSNRQKLSFAQMEKLHFFFISAGFLLAVTENNWCTGRCNESAWRCFHIWNVMLKLKLGFDSPAPSESSMSRIMGFVDALFYIFPSVYFWLMNGRILRIYSTRHAFQVMLVCLFGLILYSAKPDQISNEPDVMTSLWFSLSH